MIIIENTLSYIPYALMLPTCSTNMQQIKPPFRPQVQHDADFSNFDVDFTLKTPVVTPPESKYLSHASQKHTLKWIVNNFMDRPQTFPGLYF